MTDRLISLNAAIEALGKLPPMYSTADAIEALRALPDAWQGMGSGEDLLFQPFHPKPLPEPPK